MKNYSWVAELFSTAWRILVEIVDFSFFSIATKTFRKTNVFLPMRCSKTRPVRFKSWLTCGVKILASSITSQWTFSTSMSVWAILVNSGICSGLRNVGVITYKGTEVLASLTWAFDKIRLNFGVEVCWFFVSPFESPLFREPFKILLNWLTSSRIKRLPTSGLRPFVFWTVFTASLIWRRKKSIKTFQFGYVFRKTINKETFSFNNDYYY